MKEKPVVQTLIVMLIGSIICAQLWRISYSLGQMEKSISVAATTMTDHELRIRVLEIPDG